VFQTKIEKAQTEGRLKDYSFAPKNDILEYIISALPFIVLIGVWIYVMRRMSSGGGGAGGQIFNIGKSKAKLFDEKPI